MCERDCSDVFIYEHGTIWPMIRGLIDRALGIMLQNNKNKIKKELKRVFIEVFIIYCLFNDY